MVEKTYISRRDFFRGVAVKILPVIGSVAYMLMIVGCKSSKYAEGNVQFNRNEKVTTSCKDSCTKSCRINCNGNCKYVCNYNCVAKCKQGAYK